MYESKKQIIAKLQKKLAHVQDVSAAKNGAIDNLQNQLDRRDRDHRRLEESHNSILNAYKSANEKLQVKYREMRDQLEEARTQNALLQARIENDESMQLADNVSRPKEVVFELAQGNVPSKLHLEEQRVLGNILVTGDCDRMVCNTNFHRTVRFENATIEIRKAS